MMRHNYRFHGKHCYLRSFKTKCRKCGADVLYWECTHGSKIYFNYPPYGKLIKHYCRKLKDKNSRKKKTLIVKTPQGIAQEESPRCPACGKLFKHKQNLDEHFKQLKKTDEWHKFFDSTNFPKREEKKSDHINKERVKKPIFGKINIKKKEE